MMDVIVIEAIEQMKNLFVVFLRKVGIIAQYCQRIMNEFLHERETWLLKFRWRRRLFLEWPFFWLFKLHHAKGVSSFLKTQNLRNGGACRHPAFKFIDFGSM